VQAPAPSGSFHYSSDETYLQAVDREERGRKREHSPENEAESPAQPCLGDQSHRDAPAPGEQDSLLGGEWVMLAPLSSAIVCPSCRATEDAILDKVFPFPSMLGFPTSVGQSVGRVRTPEGESE